MPEAHLRVFRGSPGERGHFHEFGVPVEEGMVVLDALHWIQGHEAPDLAVRWNCKAAKCGSCSAEVDGRPSLTCKTRLSDFDLERADHRRADADVPARSATSSPTCPGTTRSTRRSRRSRRRPTCRRRSGAGSSRTSSASRNSASASSASCARTSATSCATTRPTSRSWARASSSAWPASRCTRSTRPTGARTSRTSGGIGYCNITKCCTEVCPEHIKITDNAIIPLKERVADEYYDPIQWVWRKLRGSGPGGSGRRRIELPVAPAGRGASAGALMRRPWLRGRRGAVEPDAPPDARARRRRSRRRARAAAGRRRGDAAGAERFVDPDRRRGARQSRVRPRSARRCTTWRGPMPATTGPSRTRRSRTISGSRPTTSPSTPGVVRALELARELGAREVHLLLDSKLIVEQLAGRWRVKDAKLIPLWSARAETLAGFERWSATHVPRAQNSVADALANEAIDRAQAGGPASVVRRP